MMLSHLPFAGESLISTRSFFSNPCGMVILSEVDPRKDELMEGVKKDAFHPQYVVPGPSVSRQNNWTMPYRLWAAPSKADPPPAAKGDKFSRVWVAQGKKETVAG